MSDAFTKRATAPASPVIIAMLSEQNERLAARQARRIETEFVSAGCDKLAGFLRAQDLEPKVRRHRTL